MTAPPISVVIPFYDEVAFIEMAVASVMSQGIDGLELIVVNDQPERFGPKDFARFNLPPGVRVLHHDANRGLSAARNTGIRAARGALVAFLDADDYFVRGGLKSQLDMAQRTGADITHAQAFRSAIGSPDTSVLRRDRLMFGAETYGAGLGALEEAQFFTSSWSSIYRRAFLSEAGLGFDEAQRKFEDRLFVLESVTAARSIALLGRPARVWRGRAGSISVTETEPETRRLQVQLLEKCMAHMQAETDAGRLPSVFLERETFNTLSRLIWDLDLIDAIASGRDPDAVAYADRVTTLLAGAPMPASTLRDPVIAPISRIGMPTRHGTVSEADFRWLHAALCNGDFDAARDRLQDRAGARTPAAPRRQLTGRRLILHVGLHKTATTYLQAHLRRHRVTLKDAGILVPQTGEGPGPEGVIRDDGFPGHLGLFRAAKSGDTDTLEALCAEIEASGCRDVLISCENMLHPYLEGRAASLEKLFAFLDVFEDRRVIAMVRRPDTWFDAHFREIALNGMRAGARSIEEFANDFEGLLLNLPALFSPFEAFAGAPVRLGDFDRAAGEGRLWPAFLDLAGLDPDLGRRCPADPQRVYPSRTREDVRAAQLVDALIPSFERRKDVLAAFLAQPAVGADDGALLPPAERRRQLDLFETLSWAFAEERGYAPTLTDWRAELDREAWRPVAGLSEATLQRLGQAGLFAVGGAATQGARPMGETARPRELILRIRPRPWLTQTVGWLGQAVRASEPAGKTGIVPRLQAPATRKPLS